MIRKITIINFMILLVATVFLSAAGCRKSDTSMLGNNITCYAAAYNKGVYKSDNGGISWYPLVSDQEDIYLYSKRLFMSSDSKRLFITTTGGGLFYVDMGKDAINSISEFRDEDIRGIVFRRPANGITAGSEILVGKKETGVYKAAEGAANWEDFNRGLAYRDVSMLYQGAGVVYAGTINGLFRCDDGSGTWVDISQGIKNRNILAIGAAPDGKTIYTGAGVYQDEKGRFASIPSLYKSLDRGSTWEKSDKGLPDGVLVFSIAVNPLRPERIYLGTSEGIYRSTDGGAKWEKTDNDIPDKYKALEIKITRLSDGRDLVYAAGANGIYMAVDEGNPEWEDRSYGLDDTYISDLLIPTR